MGNKFESKNTVLTKKLNNVIYELMVKTNSDMVYVDNKTTLTEKLYDISELLIRQDQTAEQLQKELDEIVAGSESTFNSFKEVWDYININGDPKSELIRLIESKQSAEEGKGLSTCDFTDILCEKLKNDYTKEELNAKFDIEVKQPIKALQDRVSALEEKPNVYMSEDGTGEGVKGIPDYSCWYEIISKDISTVRL